MKSICFLILFMKIFTEATLCPDKAHECPSWGTCCENRDKTYGCCPYKEADCCADFIHCCPPGTHCNVTNGSCDYGPKSLLTTSFRWMVPHYDQDAVSTVFSPADVNEVVKKTEVESNLDNVCPDGESCDEDSTCCQTQNGTFGCCPYSNADCCSDRIHCCPDGYKCDIVMRRCVKKESKYFNILEPVEVPLFNMQKAKFEDPKTDVCYRFNPCDLGGMACCPSENSRYCCPRGTVCANNGKGCVKEKKTKMIHENSFVYLENEAPKNATVKNICPDKTEECPAQSTCCLMASQRYGCCPMPSATCCADKVHCCPHGYICDNDNCEKKPYLHLFDQPSLLQKVPLE